VLAARRLTEVQDKMNKDIEKKKETRKIFRQRKEYCFNQSRKKWKFLIKNEANKFCQEVNIIIKEFKPQTLLITLVNKGSVP
jgi:hypothetical protein